MEKKEILYRQNGFSTEGIKDLKERGGDVKEVIRRNERDMMGQWLEQKIRESNYNDRYKNSTSIGIPDYLRKGERGSQKIIARWRCENEEEKNRFWKTEEEKKCRICAMGEGRIEHIMSHTRIKIGLGEVLDERGKREVMR